MKNRPSIALYLGCIAISVVSFILAYLLYSGEWAKILATGLGSITLIFSITTIANYAQRLLFAQAEEEKLAESKLSKINQNQLFSDLSLGEAQKRYQLMSHAGEIIITFILLTITLGCLYFLLTAIPAKQFPDSDVLGLIPQATYANLLILGMFYFILFIVARIIHLNSNVLIRPLGHYLGLLSIYSLTGIGFIILSKMAIESNWSFRNVDPSLLIFTTLILALLAIQYIINIIKKIYFPYQPLCCYDHGLMRLFSSHKRMFESIAKFTQFQFGISLSTQTIETFLWRNVILFLSLLGVILLLLSTINIVPLNHIAYIETLGKLNTVPLQTGIHLTAPYPFSKIYLIDNQKIRTISIGKENQTNVKWSNKDFYEYPDAFGGGKLIFNPKTQSEELVSISLDVSYTISNAFNFLFNQKNPEYTLKQIIETAIIETLISQRNSVNFFSENEELNTLLRDSINQKIQKVNLGIDIHQISFSQIMPALDRNMHEAFNNDKDAFIKGETTLVKQEKTILQQQSDMFEKCEKTLADATSYKYNRMQSVQSELINYRFDERMYAKYGSMYKQYLIIESQRKLLPSLRKFVFFIKDESLRKRLIELDYRGESTPTLLDGKTNPKNSR